MLAVSCLVTLVAVAVPTQAALLDRDLIRFIPETKILTNKSGSEALFGSPISVWGDPQRLQSVLAQLSVPRTGDEKLNFYYIGGSITEGYAGPSTGLLAPELTYIGWVEAWFEEHHPGRTAHHRRGVPAATSAYAAACVDTLVAQDADVVFVEYTVNDLSSIPGAVEAALDIPKRRGTERLLRRLLSYGKRPAVVVMHIWAPKVSQWAWAKGPPLNNFYTTYEDKWDTILKYYGIPSLSMRNALHALVRSDQPGFRIDDLWEDDIHPKGPGHAILGYMIVDYIKLVSTLAHQLKDRLAEYVPSSKLPAPMFLDNHHRKGMCGHGNVLKEYVWWKDEGWDWDIEHYDGRSSKEGFMADGVFGRKLSLRVPSGSLKHLDVQNYTAHLGMVKSWKPFGTVAVRCVDSGCICGAFEVDLHDKTAEGTMQVMTDFALARNHTICTSGCTSDCIITVEVLEKTSSKGRYVKVMSFGIDKEPGKGA